MKRKESSLPPAVAELVLIGPQDMAHLEQSLVGLRVYGEDLLPDEVTRLLGCAPTKSRPKGFVHRGASGREIVRKTGAWLLDATDAEPENIDGQVADLLARLTSDLNTWSVITQHFDVDIFCGLFMGVSNEGLEVSPDTLRALGERGIKLSLDIYGPDAETKSEN
jgi:hypothetical protein